MLESIAIIVIIICALLSVILFSAFIVVMIDMYDKDIKCSIVSKKQLYELLKQHRQMQNYALDLFTDKKYNRFPRE